MLNVQNFNFLLTKQYYYSFFLRDERTFRHTACFLWITEVFLSFFVINRIPYTEIDWSTYMQQVECYTKKGISNYTQIGGDTGPLVYPGGHLFVYTILYHLTNSGKNIRFAQYLFMILYLANLAIVFKIYYRTKQIPAFVLIFMTLTGYRIHSIFMLRLFNDPIAMFIFYLAVSKIQSHQWLIGCSLYSVAVSIKMNILLFSPALFFTLLLNTGIKNTFGYIALCGIIQLYAGLPFLIFDWKSYIIRSFDLGRVFMFKWTVNWRFLPESIFLDKRFHVSLLIGHITFLIFFAYFMWFRNVNGLKTALKKNFKYRIITETGPTDTFYAFCTCNLIGIAFSRSLHYQFYSWYYHQLPFLLFFNYPIIKHYDDIPWAANMLKCVVLLMIETCWNVYPSTKWSSALLHFLHASILIYLILNRNRRPIDKKLKLNKEIEEEIFQEKMKNLKIEKLQKEKNDNLIYAESIERKLKGWFPEWTQTNKKAIKKQEKLSNKCLNVQTVKYIKFLFFKESGFQVNMSDENMEELNLTDDQKLKALIAVMDQYEKLADKFKYFEEFEGNLKIDQQNVGIQCDLLIPNNDDKNYNKNEINYNDFIIRNRLLVQNRGNRADQ